ncbi:hypothetical protein R3P38DRAFT_3212313 [Favolaschia claudopus]|uniref:Secreted protein n=1 Tax=Favolaschia claudopus TaxID=2862362 RepID=A0AAW0AFW4_9AGAR
MQGGIRFLATTTIIAYITTQTHHKVYPAHSLIELTLRIARDRPRRYRLPSRRWGAQRPSTTCSASLLLVCAAADFDEEDILQVASIKRPKPATPGRC